MNFYNAKTLLHLQLIGNGREILEQNNLFFALTNFLLIERNAMQRMLNIIQHSIILCIIYVVCIWLHNLCVTITIIHCKQSKWKFWLLFYKQKQWFCFILCIFNEIAVKQYKREHKLLRKNFTRTLSFPVITLCDRMAWR